MRLLPLLCVGVLLCNNPAARAQDAGSDSKWSITTAVSSLAITIEDAEDFNEIDWNSLRTILMENPETQPVQVSFILKQEAAADGTTSGKDFTMSFHGTREHMDSILENARKSLLYLLEE